MSDLDAPSSRLGWLRSIAPREVWSHKARDFTQWLLLNADVLSDVLGMQLELTEAEHTVGGFSLDLIGSDLTTGETVIVENQLERTDHAHMGQLLTYAGGTDAVNVVWCAPPFREEHRAALNWLNARTDENARFFGVEIAVVRIDESRPAPSFRLVAQPNDWSKQAHAGSTDTVVRGKRLAYSEFWCSCYQADCCQPNDVLSTIMILLFVHPSIMPQQTPHTRRYVRSRGLSGPPPDRGLAAPAPPTQDQSDTP
jgi:hypothetical protein